MASGIIRLAFRSAWFYRRQVIYQVLIIALLSSVITGSLLTGWSVRSSLSHSSSVKLGKTGLLITSGPRYIGSSLTRRLKENLKINAEGVLETEGFCQNLATQKGAFKSHIWAVDSGFFRFHGIDSVSLNDKEVAINQKLARSLGLRTGDELIIRFRNISAIPADAPFSPGKDEDVSIVLKVARILDRDSMGDFSLSINQLVPGNIFISLSGMNSLLKRNAGINRILISRENNIRVSELQFDLRKCLKPGDLGLRIIEVKKAGLEEMRSERIFMDRSLIENIRAAIPESYPVITYLGNRFSKGIKSTPYSFISALPKELYPEAPDKNQILISSWLSEDLNAKRNDTLKISWYSPDSLNKLIERSGKFVVSDIAEPDSKLADSLLMPEFPGIAGSESCSDWDAGVQIKFNEIRPKDEDYWKRYKGRPKAFLNYDDGVRIWGSNFGPATAIRFPGYMSVGEIDKRLSGKLSPEANGLVIKDLYKNSVSAANEGVDFSSLFLSLGIFLIVSSLILLAFAFSSYLESRHEQIKTYFALGFRRRRTELLILTEAGFVVLTGSVAGSASGILVNAIIIKLLNTVWQGAVQTSALSSYTSMQPVVAGFISTALLSWMFIAIRLRRHMKILFRKRKARRKRPEMWMNLLLMIISFMISAALFFISFFVKGYSMALSFTAGSILFFALILALKQYFIMPAPIGLSTGSLSKLYYSFNPLHALTPVMFIAAGIFAVFITGANRVSGKESDTAPSGGTGGFLIWCDTSIPLKDNLSTETGREELGLDGAEFNDIKFVQLKRNAGDDASCLNLNHVTMPPVIGADPKEFIKRGSFSFATSVSRKDIVNPWQFLDLPAENNTIYGVADQTVLEWGLKINSGDTLKMRTESGQRLNIVMAAGLKSSVFQGYVIISMANFKKYFPSVSGSSLLLINGEPSKYNQYRTTLTDLFQGYGPEIQNTSDRLATFNEVTNTYLSVFGVFGALGIISGVAGLGFILIRNYNHRKKEFALMMATGFSLNRIKRMIFTEQMFILASGIVTGILSAIIATFHSLMNNQEIPWIELSLMVSAIVAAGTTALLFSMKNIENSSLTSSLKKE